MNESSGDGREDCTPLRELEDRLFVILFGDPETREAAVTQLLAEHPEHAEALRARWQEHRVLEGGEPQHATIEQIVPGFRLLAVLGEGGMGTVYRAEQFEPQRFVALKVIKRGMDSKLVLARFEMERQALAAMEHEAIARVYACGTTTHGQPFFAMELVPGQPLQRYCDRHRMPLPERLRLFQQVCEGVQHAHQKGIVHRDLKPGNILVFEREGQAVAKIIDFGVARAADPGQMGGTLFTEPGVVIGTPEYMSPEQAAGNIGRVDTRSDVYSLGVVLYELLVGVLPFPGDELRAAGIAEIQRRLREEEPPTPSRRLTALGKEATTCASARAIDQVSLRRELARDLDWVVLRAMAKEPERRYGSAQALADDLGRYLANEPLLAGPPSAGYRLRKLLRRHRGRVAAGAAVLVTAMIGAALVVQFALRERQKVREFDLLSGVVQYEQAMAAERRLYPAWPDQVVAMETWLRDQCAPLLAMRPMLAQTFADLQSRALPHTEAQRQADRRSHPRFAEVQALARMVASLQRADELRAGAIPVLSELTAEQAAFPQPALERMAWDRVAPDWRERRVFDEEAFGLACAAAAVAKAMDTADEAASLATLAWALLANGRDAEARQRIEEAVAKAPADRVEAVGDHRRRLLARLESRGDVLEQLRAELAIVEAEVGERRTWQFRSDDVGGRFLHVAIPDLVAKLQHLDAVVKPGVEKQLAWARQLGEMRAGHPKARHTWDEVRAAIAEADDLVASRLYAGQDIAIRDEDVQGLVPIGMNPVTRLWEFYDLRSAWNGAAAAGDIEIPVHGEDGSIAVGDDTGIVFVLLPGAVARIGAQRDDPQAPHHDVTAEPRFGPVHSVPLAPFLLARHELTQGQWARLWRGAEAQRHPSQNKSGATRDGETFTLAHPVEQVDWPTCVELLAQVGLVLPTEAQWEYACRAGTAGPWWCDRTGLQKVANLSDQKAKAAGFSWGGQTPWDDGFALLAPVGTFPANPFGLHDLHGNVGEWCLDAYGEYTGPVRAGDGLRLHGDGSNDRVIRGGCCGEPPKQATAAFRRHAQPNYTSDYVGLRPARSFRRGE